MSKISEDIAAEEAKLSTEAKAELAKIRAMAVADESATLAYFKTHKGFVIAVLIAVVCIGLFVGHYL